MINRFTLITNRIILLFILGYSFISGQSGTYYDALDPSNSNFVTDLESRIRSPYTQVSYNNFDETNIANFASIDNSNGTRSVFCVYSRYEYIYSETYLVAHES